MAAEVQRNLQAGGGLYINKWWTGVVTQRSPLFVPISAMGLQIVSRLDAMWDGGLNWELSSTQTPVRRPGYGRYSSAQFSSSDYPLNWYSYKNLAGTIVPLVDTPTHVWSFTTGALTSVLAKSGTGQMSFETVGDPVYMCDGNDSDTKKDINGTVTKWGIVKPANAPTLAFVAGSLTILTGYQYVYVYKNSSTGHISTASAASVNTGAQTSKNVQVTVVASADGQVDAIDIYRTNDGGTVYFFLASVANANGTYTDSTPDSGLNNLLIAPLQGNDPPPSGISLTVFHEGRMWVASGRNVYWGNGPEVTNGVKEECFSIANIFPFPGNVTAMVSTSIGLIVFTAANAYIIKGFDLSTFQRSLWQKNFGVSAQNSVDQDGDTIFIYTTRGQLFQIDTGLDEIGFSIRAKLQAFTPANVYIALHRSGDDEGLFVGNGSTDVWRYSFTTQSWSPVAQPVGGIRAIKSIELTTANWTLMAGRTSGSGYILSRTPGTFLDDGSTYTGNFVVGALIIAPPGKTGHVDSVLVEAMNVGTYPTVSVRLNEISGAFVALPNPVNDPPKLLPSSTLTMKRHYLKAAQVPLAQDIRFMFVQFSFAAENTKNEVLGLGLG